MLMSVAENYEYEPAWYLWNKAVEDKWIEGRGLGTEASLRGPRVTFDPTANFLKAQHFLQPKFVFFAIVIMN